MDSLFVDIIASIVEGFSERIFVKLCFEILKHLSKTCDKGYHIKINM